MFVVVVLVVIFNTITAGKEGSAKMIATIRREKGEYEEMGKDRQMSLCATRARLTIGSILISYGVNNI